MSLSVRDFQNSTVALRSVENIRTAAVVNIGGVGDGVKSHYAAIFDRYANVQNNLLKQLNAVFGSNIPLDSNRHVVFTDFIKDVCTDSDRANEAYKFYGRQIIEQINQLGDYILKARDFLRQTGDADIEKWVIDQLNILDIFSNEIEKAFGFRYVYDFNEDAWKSVEDDYTAQTHTQVQKQTTYEKLRAVQVDAYEKEGVFTKKVIEVFNELNLLDRLKYIKLYYDINDGKTDALFPNDKISGTPIVKEASNTEIIGAIESFFMGYLIDRDGPVNAMSSFLEIKSATLIEKIRLETQKIKALNAYLKFLGRALDVLNASQSGADGDKTKHRIPDGVMVALNYICGGNMYNVFEQNGQAYLVLESNYKSGNCFLVKADESGMNFLIGDNGIDNNYRGNAYCRNYAFNGNPVLTASLPTTTPTPIETQSMESKQAVFYYRDIQTKTHEKRWLNGFNIPKKLDCAKIIPNSVRKYTQFGDSRDITADVVSSWQKAFQNKISFVRTMLDTVNTDIKVLRNKIDSLSTMSTTFRNRSYNAYVRVVSNLKK